MSDTYRPPSLEEADLDTPAGIREAFDSQNTAIARWSKRIEERIANPESQQVVVNGTTQSLAQSLKKGLLRSGAVVGYYTSWGTAKSWAVDGIYVCDGGNGTPPIHPGEGEQSPVQRYLKATAWGDDAWDANKSARTGGSSTHTHVTACAGSHGHNAQVAGGHAHTMGDAGGHTHAMGCPSAMVCVCCEAEDIAATGDHTHEIGAAGGHTHTVVGEEDHTHTVDDDGEHAHDVTAGTVDPPHVELIFVMVG